MRVLASVLLLALFGAQCARAEVKVSIVSFPDEIFSFEPLYVLYAIENSGAEPVYVPAESGLGRGTEVFIGIGDEEPGPTKGFVVDYLISRPSNTMWLAPGERWLVLEDVGHRLRVLEGTATLQVVMSSKGVCGAAQVGGRQAFPLAPLRLGDKTVGSLTYENYACWEGEVRSQPKRVRIRASAAEVDVNAKAELIRDRRLTENPEKRTWALKRAWDVYKRFPSSHFAYAVLASGGASVVNKMKAVELQPENPLNQWTRIAIGKDVLDYRSSCWSGQHLEFDFDPFQQAIPAPGRDFLVQYAWALENRVCPLKRAAAEAEKGRAQ